MTKSVFEIREQVGQIGHYCSITFNVEEVSSNQPNLLVEYYGDVSWETICRSGAQIFFEYYIRIKQASLKVKILEVRWMPIDTQALTVLFATIKGLSENLDIQIEDLYFQKSRLCYSIPDPRVMRHK